MTDMHSLVDRAMVMNLSIGIWQGYRLDKEASRKVTDQAGASADAARVNKHLVPKEALAPVVTSAGAVRTHFYDNTLPWRDNGDRLMTRKLYLSFIEEHERLVGEFKAEVSKFLDEKYPSAIAQSEFRMGALFKREDYPAVEHLRHRFYVGLDIDPLTTSNDFRVAIDADHVEKVKASMEAAAEKRVQQAQAEVWRRLLERVSYFADRMTATTVDKNGEPKPAVFRDSTIDNLDDIVALVPGLNVFDDPDIEAMRQQVIDKLGGHDADDIRKDPDLRRQLAGEAKGIVDKMAGFMRAFGAGDE